MAARMSATIMATMATDARSLARLMAWLSPAFPVGAFGYSHGLEQAVADGRIRDGGSLFHWLAALIEHGSAWNDAVLMAAAWRAVDAADLTEVADLALALCPSVERRRETRDQGWAFLAAATTWAEASGTGPPARADLPYPVAVGAEAARAGLPLGAALTAFLHAFTANLVTIAVRAVPLGQTAGVATLALLEPVVLTAAERAARSTVDDLGAAALLSDIASMRHETLRTRIFVT
jgi:urease accessory protein